MICLKKHQVKIESYLSISSIKYFVHYGQPIIYAPRTNPLNNITVKCQCTVIVLQLDKILMCIICN